MPLGLLDLPDLLRRKRPVAKEFSVDALQGLPWLADAPLFIDSAHVDAFYDAVVAPEAEELSITRTVKGSQQISGNLALGAKGTISLSHFIKHLFPFVDATVGVDAEAGGGVKRETGEDTKIEFRRISTPQRRLVQLAFHYAIDLPDRLRFVSPDATGVWRKPPWEEPAFVEQVPRAVLFLDLPRGTKLIPVALEGADGVVVPMFRKLRGAGGIDPPAYPEGQPSVSEARRQEYWSWFIRNHTATTAMQAVEDGAKATGGLIHWIDYRLALGNEGSSAHVHVCSRGRYETGVFAYNMVVRAEESGLRVVATLKGGPDFDVLAVFNR